VSFLLLAVSVVPGDLLIVAIFVFHRRLPALCGATVADPEGEGAAVG